MELILFVIIILFVLILINNCNYQSMFIGSGPEIFDPYSMSADAMTAFESERLEPVFRRVNLV